MKLHNIIKLLIVVTFSVLILSCAKNEKDKIIVYNNAITEWVSSPDFISEMKEKVKTPEGIFEYLENKRNEIAKTVGFKDYFEAERIIKKYAEDDDIIQSLSNREAKFSKAMSESVSKFQEDLIKATNPIKDVLSDTFKDSSTIK